MPLGLQLAMFNWLISWLFLWLVDCWTVKSAWTMYYLCVQRVILKWSIVCIDFKTGQSMGQRLSSWRQNGKMVTSDRLRLSSLTFLWYGGAVRERMWLVQHLKSYVWSDFSSQAVFCLWSSSGPLGGYKIYICIRSEQNSVYFMYPFFDQAEH